MTKEDLIRKITSRKFIVALIGFVTPLLVLFNVDNLTIEKVVALITGACVLIAYIFAEAQVDASAGDTIIEELVEIEKIEE